jgi:hypothetical protein
LSSLSYGNYIGTGYQELDLALGGGFAKKAVILIEMESNVNTWVAIAFLSSLISNFIQTSNPVLFQAFDGVDPKEVGSYLKSESDPNIDESELLKVLCYVGKTHESSSQYTTTSRDQYWQPEKYIEFLHEVITKTRQEYPNRLLLNVMGTNIVQKMNANAEIAKTKLFSFIRANTDLSLIVGRGIHDTQERIPGIYDVHLRFLVLHGSLFLQSLIPWSHLYAVVPPASSRSGTVKLDPIV